ncbi:MAG: serine hydrolase [Gemmatimonadales bacterium]|nr:serine hydrolase [Gemmatimonadales bacterium]
MSRPGPRSLAIPAALALLTAWNAAAAQQPAAAWPRRVDSLFAHYIRPDGPGCAVGVYRRGEVLLTRGYGLSNVDDGRRITPRTTFNLGSTSKAFTALAALLLEQSGRLSLDDAVRRWIPELPDYGHPIRVRDLLQHTSGLRDYGALEALSGKPIRTMPEFLGVLASQQALNFAPGSRHEYSHSDYVLLGVVVERVAGEPFGAHLERAVLRPIGMNGSFVYDRRPRRRTERAVGHAVSMDGRRADRVDSAVVLFPDSWITGGSNVYASVEDLARWDRQFERPAVGGRGVMARMLSRPTLENGDTIPYAWGLRLGEHGGLRTISRGGHDGGMRSQIIRFPDQHLTVTTLCNADHLEPWRLAEGVADIYLEDRMRPAAARPTAPAAVTVAGEELVRYAGVYRSKAQLWNPVWLERRGGVLGEVLFHEVRDDTLIAMTPVGGNRFVEIGLTGNVGIYTFRPGTRGTVAGLDVAWNGGPPESFERVADSSVWRPSGTELSQYAGEWYSPDLETVWRFEVRGTRLVLRRLGRPDLTLRPVDRDEFVRGFGPWVEDLYARLQFRRDEAGRPAELRVSTPPGEDSAREVRFVRMGGSP